MTFHVGQKVVCVDASLPANPWHRAYPLIKNMVYVVRSTSAEYWQGQPCIDIDGSGREWQNWRFRPVAERKTDIAIFRRLLTPTDNVSA